MALTLVRQVHLEIYIICHNWCLLDQGFSFQPGVFNGCHDVLLMPLNINSISVLDIHGFDYCFVINGIRKTEVVSLF